MNVLKWFVKFRAGDFSLDDAPQSGGPGEVDSDQTETLIVTYSMLYHEGDIQHAQNIQINKVIAENEKCVFYFTNNNN